MFHMRSVFVEILDCQIAMCVLHGAEIWGLKEVPEIERVHVCTEEVFECCQPNSEHYATSETGRYPLFVNIAIKAVKYWLRVAVMSQESFLFYRA